MGSGYQLRGRLIDLLCSRITLDRIQFISKFEKFTFVVNLAKQKTGQKK